MGLKAINQLRENVKTLLRVRKEDQKTLAFAIGRHPTTINKFLKGTREIQLQDLDRMADFFGLATYQLFQPGISLLTERRQGPDRRTGRERRVGHRFRALQGPALMSLRLNLVDRKRPIDGRTFADRYARLTLLQQQALELLLTECEATGPVQTQTVK